MSRYTARRPIATALPGARIALRASRLDCARSNRSRSYLILRAYPDRSHFPGVTQPLSAALKARPQHSFVCPSAQVEMAQVVGCRRLRSAPMAAARTAHGLCRNHLGKLVECCRSLRHTALIPLWTPKTRGDISNVATLRKSENSWRKSQSGRFPRIINPSASIF